MAELLKEYQINNWVEHPKALSILALMSMCQEGKTILSAISKIDLE
jgi:hypothetical protein